MALSDKNIVITPNIGATADPKLVFSGADASTTAQNITLTAYPTNSGTLSFDGSAGQLFSITNSLSGTIFSVNDVSGIPSIEVLDTGTIKLGQYSGNILLGTVTDNGNKLQVNGSVSVTGQITSTIATGTAPFVITSTTAVANLSIGGNAATVTNGVYTTTAQTLTNKSLSDSTTFFIDETDGTKKLQFQLSSITTATTRTLTIPDVSGTIITTGDTGTVTSTMIADGTIVNGDISASAAIAITKLASSTISGVSLGSSLNALTISSPLTGTSYNGSAAVSIGIPAATTSVSGYLTSTDWNTFNGKQAAGSYLTASTGVTTFNGGTTGLTPASATSGAITLAGTLAVANGGTGRTTTNPKLIGSFTVAAADTNWWRVAAMDGSNQPRYAKFLIVTTNHLNIEITFSNGAGGDYGHVEVVVRGHYVYWTTYPSFIRYNPTGTNLPSYVEIQLPLTGGTGNTFTVYELENFSSANLWVTYPMATTGVATAAGTSLQFFSNTAILRRDGYIGNGYTKEMNLAAATASVNGYMTSTYASKLDGIASGATANTGTVTSVGFTGGLLTVATATTTPAITVAGTSGGIPYFSSASTWATSAALAANSLVIGGGAGVAPSTTTTGTGVVTALGVAVGTAGSFVTNGGALGTPSSGTLTNCTFPTLNQNTTGSSGSCTGNAATATTATNQSGGTVSATTGSFSGQLSVAQSTSLINNGINLSGNGYLRGTANDNATSTLANVQLMSWFGIGFSPSIAGQTVPQGENAAWINVRSGDFACRGNVTAYSSDKRLKTNFKTIDNALNKINKISGYEFDWDIDKCFSLGFKPRQKHEHGVKAQEIQEIIPDAVELAPFDKERDEDDNEISRSGENYLTVNYERIIPLLIEAIKEQQVQIDELKELINKGE